jgi:hypothetical protein
VFDVLTETESTDAEAALAGVATPAAKANGARAAAAQAATRAEMFGLQRFTEGLTTTTGEDINPGLKDLDIRPRPPL